MKKINKLIKILFLTIVTLAFSCSDVLVNEDPNGVVIDELPPEVILPGAQTLPAATLMTTMNELGNTMVATWSGNAQQVQAPYFVEFQYQLSTDFYSGIWDNLMAVTGNLTQIINNRNPGNYDYFKGASKIYRAFYFQYLVDLYGDIPFSEIHQRGANLFPSYDNQQEIYVDLITQINNAIIQMNTTDANSVIPMGTNDVIMGGNISQWIKFGNSIKLRMLLRMYDYAQTDPHLLTFLNDEFALLNQTNAAFLTVGDDVTINPGYVDQSNRMNPFVETFGYDPGQFGVTGSQTFSNLRAGPTTFLVEFLDGTSTNIVDARLDRLYATRGGQTSIQGNTQGGGDQPSRIGPGLLMSPEQDGYIMTASESLFLQSEAVFKGLLTSGNAKNLFQSAIQSSFDRLGSSIGTYLTDSNNVDKIGWDGSSNKLEAIITQKWIDLGGTNGIETWIEYTVTGFPSNMPLPRHY
ncbi:SusD/RagB family nutrient-binding outer membrane lipoprotein [Lacinutrix neustonica]|uniref:SusD/RagB family nutrient-binding outer membrane lipoprotein n=1 Tax=Lacinutrix neustonica TaxID=2980107 RepID=A0A9E8MYY5_9FLAO|nr:SusD/RagB family nutrient-binding outer membrane lipoprotein [Lacinutrix neustonica]WAC03586.1 SusD/RagB family nutrient-binding outer membrane lipoprotein [Lacinutrix neustonica]